MDLLELAMVSWVMGYIEEESKKLEKTPRIMNPKMDEISEAQMLGDKGYTLELPKVEDD